jgi:hypothetical protein
VEIESGKKNHRPQLLAAIAEARQAGATLLIAKLDRLSRNAGFIFALRDSGVDFVCCDMPDANTLTVGLFAVIAQHERETISKRTKDALAAKKARGTQLGSPQNFTTIVIAQGRPCSATPASTRLIGRQRNWPSCCAPRGRPCGKLPLSSTKPATVLDVGRSFRLLPCSVCYWFLMLTFV